MKNKFIEKKLFANDALSLSNRTIDENGFLHVANNILSNAEISEYVGREILGYEKLGLDPNKIYKIYRPADELEKSASTFNNLPLLSDHIQISSFSPKKDMHIGSLGTDIRIEGDKLIGSLIVIDQKYIDKIESDEIVGLSCSYSYVPVIESGSYNGKDYDIKMTEIAGNHIALVKDPRVSIAGVSDTKEKINNFKKGKNMFKTLFKIFAKDSEVSKEDIVKAILAMSKREAEEFEGGEAEQLEAIAELVKKLEAPKAEDETNTEDKPKNEDGEVQTGEPEKTKEEVNAEDEDLVVSADEDMDEEKASASDSKTLFKKIKAFDSAVSLVEKVAGKVNRDSFNYNANKLVSTVLKQKGIACDSKNYSQKIAMLEVLAQTKQVAPKVETKKTTASDSSNSSKSIFDILNNK